MTKRSRHTYDETIALLKERMVAAGNTIFDSIDQAAAAKGVGLQLRPTTLIIFGNPKGGTALMDSFPLVALELPLKVAVWEENGAVDVAYVSMSKIAQRYGVTGMDERIAAMDAALEQLTDSIV